MKRILFYFVFIFLLFNTKAYSQELSSKKYIKTIYKSYTTELILSKKQALEFHKILEIYNKKLEVILTTSNSNQKNEFNKMLKLQDLEVYYILDRTQFETYKKIKKIIEPIKKYKL